MLIFTGAGGGAGNAAATVGATAWFGGMLLILAGIGEFLLGNTFPFLVFMCYGSHFLTFSTVTIPEWGAISSYNSATDGTFGAGAQTEGAAFTAGFGMPGSPRSQLYR